MLVQRQRRSQQTRDVEPLSVQCWASVVDGGPTLNQQWLNVSSLLGWANIWLGVSCYLGYAHRLTPYRLWPGIGITLCGRGGMK